MNVVDGELRSQNKPPSDEGGGFAVGEDGGRETGSVPKKSLSLSHGLRRDFASLTLIRGSQKRYIAVRCDIRLRCAIYFRKTEMRYVHRFRTMNVADGELRSQNKPPLCKGRWRGVSRDGGIDLLRVE